MHHSASMNSDFGCFLCLNQVKFRILIFVLQMPPLNVQLSNNMIRRRKNCQLKCQNTSAWRNGDWLPQAPWWWLRRNVPRETPNVLEHKRKFLYLIAFQTSVIVWDCGISSGDALEIPQSCTWPSSCSYWNRLTTYFVNLFCWIYFFLLIWHCKWPYSLIMIHLIYYGNEYVTLTYSLVFNLVFPLVLAL